MEYKKGHTIKPKETLENGVVVFTDGTSDVSPNQISCEAYGYKWDRKSSTCYGFSSNFKIGKLFQNTTNTKIGAENVTNKGTENTFINGTKNTTKGNNRNLLICGESHEVSNGISNASVFGTYGKALRQAEVVIGGGIGTADYPLGNNQTSIVQLGGLTINASATDLTISGDGASYIAVQNNSILGFEVKVIGICYGGSSGTAGDYKYIEIKGAVKVDNGYNTTFSQSSTTIASVGTTGVAVMADVTDPNITVEVTGTANVNVEWFASVQLTENKLNSVTF
tara:strand:+ start:2574 stop:3416 length:843 start_codon:yes stop_codon:yes gene_type:complete